MFLRLIHRSSKPADLSALLRSGRDDIIYKLKKTPHRNWPVHFKLLAKRGPWGQCVVECDSRYDASNQDLLVVVSSAKTDSVSRNLQRLY